MTALVKQSLRERKQERVYADLVSAGLKLFQERGYDETTVDDIADAAEVSRRTLFRYFDTKADIVLVWMRGTTTRLQEALAEQPASETPLAAVRAAFRQLNESFAMDEGESTALARLCTRTPSLRSHSFNKHADWEEAIVSFVSRRLPDEPDRQIKADLIARASVAAFRTALDAFLTDGETRSLSELTDHCFDLMQADFGLGKQGHANGR